MWRLQGKDDCAAEGLFGLHTCFKGFAKLAVLCVMIVHVVGEPIELQDHSGRLGDTRLFSICSCPVPAAK